MGATDIETCEIEEAIFNARVAGRSMRSLAREFRCPERDIAEIVDRFCGVINNRSRLQSLALEVERLDNLNHAYVAKALAGDIAAAHLCVKIGERRASLLGLDASTRLDAVQVQITERRPVGDIDEIEAILDRLCGKPDATAALEHDKNPDGSDGGFVQ